VRESSARDRNVEEPAGTGIADGKVEANYKAILSAYVRIGPVKFAYRHQVPDRRPLETWKSDSEPVDLIP